MVHMDHLYPGWDGLAESSSILATRILHPLSQAGPAAYARWDWEEVPLGGSVAVEPADSSSSRGAVRASDPRGTYVAVSVFVDADPALRMRRGLARDGDAYRPHWQRWAVQERRSSPPATGDGSRGPGHRHDGPGIPSRRWASRRDEPSRTAERVLRPLPPTWLMAVALVAVAGNLRVAITSVPPLLDAIESDLGLSGAAAGALTTLPVLCMGLFAPLASRFAHPSAPWRGPRGGGCIVVGTASRLLGDNLLVLYTGTFVAGAGIAVAGTLLPRLVKTFFPPERVGLVTGSTCSP